MMRLYDIQNDNEDEESIIRLIWTYIRKKESFDVKIFLNELRSQKPTQKAKKISLTNRIDSVISKLNASNDQNNDSLNQDQDKVMLMELSDFDDDIFIDIDSNSINEKINYDDEDDTDNEDENNNNLLPMTTRDIDSEFKQNWRNVKRGKREPNWEIAWRNLTESLNELRNNNDDNYLEYYTLILKLHVQNKVKLSHKCIEAMLNCLDPSHISFLFDLKLINPDEINYIYSIFEKNLLFSAFKTNPFESDSLNPFYLIMSLSVLLYKTKCKPFRKHIIITIQKELAIMINLNLYDEKFKKIGVKCFVKAAILNGLFDRESINTFLDITDKSSNSFNNRMIRHGHNHHHRDDDSDEFDDEDEDSELDDDSEDFDDDEDIDDDDVDEIGIHDFIIESGDDDEGPGNNAIRAFIRRNIEPEQNNNYAPRSPSQTPPPPPPLIPAPPPPVERIVLGRRMPVERRVIEPPVQPPVIQPVVPPKKKSVADYIDNSNDLRNVFPLSLKNLARIQIKNSMDIYNECNVLNLKVQYVLCKFILFQDEIDSIVKSVNLAKAPKHETQTNSNNASNNDNNNTANANNN